MKKTNHKFPVTGYGKGGKFEHRGNPLYKVLVIRRMAELPVVGSKLHSLNVGDAGIYLYTSSTIIILTLCLRK